MNCAHNSSISIDKYLPGNAGTRLTPNPPISLQGPGGSRAGWCKLLCPPAPALLLAMLKDWGFPTLVQAAALWEHLSPAHTSLTQTQTHPATQVQAALTLQPWKLKQRGKPRQRLKWDYFLMGATTTTHHHCARGNYKQLSITEDELLKVGSQHKKALAPDFHVLGKRRQSSLESQFLVKYFNSHNNIQNICRQSHEFWVWKYHAFLGGLILPIRQDIICFSKSVQESLFQIKRNILFWGPSKSNTHSHFSDPFINMGLSMTQLW